MLIISTNFLCGCQAISFYTRLIILLIFTNNHIQNNLPTKTFINSTTFQSLYMRVESSSADRFSATNLNKNLHVLSNKNIHDQCTTLQLHDLLYTEKKNGGSPPSQSLQSLQSSLINCYNREINDFLEFFLAERVTRSLRQAYMNNKCRKISVEANDMLNMIFVSSTSFRHYLLTITSHIRHPPQKKRIELYQNTSTLIHIKLSKNVIRNIG